MNHDRNNREIGVLGAGLMGCCLALELAQRGYRVDLIERASMPMTGASLHNEGKLHLGFVYANDPLKKTYGLMLRGSLAFMPILGRLTGCCAADLKPSQPFHYFVPRDSQLDMAAIEDHFQKIKAGVREYAQSNAGLYLERRIDRCYQRNPSSVHERLFSARLTQGSFATEEQSISLVALARILRGAIKKQPNVNFIGDTEILGASRLADSEVEIETCRRNGSVQYRYCGVANCLWDDRVRIDRSAGVCEDVAWMFRYKVTVNITAPNSVGNKIPSATGIVGSYGDVVNHNDGSYYISWYPISKIAQCTTHEGRRLHDEVHQGVLPVSIRKMTSGFPLISKFVTGITHRRFIKDNIREMAAYVPSMGELLTSKIRGELGGGVIVARGNTDIDDPSSSLHQRWSIGPVAYGSYVTVDTGKLCMAPLFAQQTADMMADILQ